MLADLCDSWMAQAAGCHHCELFFYAAAIVCHSLPSKLSPLPSPLPSFHWGTVSVRSTSTFRRSSWAASRPFQSTTPARTRFSHRRSSSTLSSSPSLPRFGLRHQLRQEGGEEVVEGFGLSTVAVCWVCFCFGRWGARRVLASPKVLRLGCVAGSSTGWL